ncbi:MAG TPA: hypothetical protein PLY87_21825 [Planctomycetaceae bacterium]|nr:hypothetical protein [Planctomycetaceae bacterium]
MAGISIACASCGASLKLPDASLVGKRVKCPKCGVRFVLTVPQLGSAELDEVPLQLVDVPVQPASPMVGTSARWVPDAPAASLPHASLDFTAKPAAPELGNFNIPIAQPESAAAPFAVPGLAINPEPTTGSAIGRVKGRHKKSLSVPMIATLVTLLVGIVAGGIWFMRPQSVNATTGRPKIQPNEAYQESVAELAVSNDAAKSLSPTSGEVIPVDYLPFTPQVLCHMHPAELWKEDRNTAEFQAMLSTLGIWLKEQIELRTRFTPQEISELTFAVNFGPRMSAPEVAAVVRLANPQSDEEYRKRFTANGGRFYADLALEQQGIELYEAKDFCYLKVNETTFALAPANMSESLKMSFKDPALLSSDMEMLVTQSDRNRHLTLMFDLGIVDSHREDAFIPQLQQLADKFLFWFGKDVQSVSWSLHLEPNLYMETLLHQTQASTPPKLHRSTQLHLSKLPDDMLRCVRFMRPGTVGSRQMIGRFPSMIKAMEIGTTTHIDSVGVRLVTLLPRNAAANLAAGAMLTWNQSLLTNFDDDSHLTKTEIMKIPETVAERLKMPVLVDFRATPLQEAMEFIGDSIKTEVTIDGDAMKGAGFTQVMAQTYNLGSVSALKAIDTIFAKYAGERDPMVMIVDEAAKKITISTVSKAKEDGLTPYPTK